MNGLLELARHAKQAKEEKAEADRFIEERLERQAIVENLQRLGVPVSYSVKQGAFGRACVGHPRQGERAVLCLDGFVFSVPRGEYGSLDVQDYDDKARRYYWRRITDLTDLLDITTEEQANATEESA